MRLLVHETREGIKKWEEEIIDKVLADDNLEYNATKYWRLRNIVLYL